MKVKAYKAMLDNNSHPYMMESGESYNIDGRKSFDNPDDIYYFIAHEIGLVNAADEHVYVLCLNTKLKLIGLFEASHGSVNESLFPIREIFQKSLLLGATAIILTHNHPSGDATPSSIDVPITKKAMTAGEIIGVKVLDHLVVAKTYYCSMFKQGLIQED